MPLTKLTLRPGIDRSNTNYGNVGGYYTCDKIRFRDGTPEKIGGWVKYSATTYLGAARALFVWVSLSGTQLLAVGTNQKYYVESGGGFADVTPFRTTNVALTSNPFAATASSKTVVVTHSGHGAADGDFVVISGAVGFATIPAGDLNGEHTISYINLNSYSFVVNTTATATATGGGSVTLASFELSAASNVAVPGLGWNAGTWNKSTWNTPRPLTSATYSRLRLWTQECFGEDHVFAPIGGAIYYWKVSNGLSTRAVPLTSLSGADNTPLFATKILLSTSDRHLIVFGTNPIGSATIDPLFIRWADTESVTTWTPAITNAAGGIRLSSGDRIVTATPLKREILVFTNSAVFSMQFIGAPDIFGVQPVANNTTIISPNGVAVARDTVYWMGNDKFYTYNGRVDTLHCTINKFIFDNLNLSQRDQTFAGTNEGFNEIWWFYCSKNSTSVDSYVIYNYLEHVWSYGTMNRTAWLDSPLKTSPMAAGNSVIYLHENGVDDDRINPINAYIESCDFDITEGNEFSFVKRVIPDITFAGSTAVNPVVTMTITPRNAPGATYKDGNASAIMRSVAVPIEKFTERCDVRLRGRQMKVRIESTGLGVQWKMGVPRVEVQPDGKK